MKIPLFAVLLLSCSAQAAPWVLPAANQRVWVPGTNTGVTGGINQYRVGGASARTNLIDVSAAPYNADKTGATSCNVAVQAAIDASSANDVIYFPAGLYKLTYSLSIEAADSNKSFRGAPGDASVIYGSSANALFSFQGGGGLYGTNAQALTGTKTFGTSNLTVASSTGYTVGTLATVFVENEWNNTRILAGAPPTWDNSGFPDKRAVVCRVTAVPDATHITVDPPLQWDCTVYATRIERSALDLKLSKIGFEDLVFTFDAANHPPFAISMDHAVECWAYNIKAPEWKKATSSGSVVNIDSSYKSEVRKCDFRTLAKTTYSDDGAIQILNSSNLLIEDNIAIDFDSGIYDSGKTYNNLCAYNYMPGEDGNYPGHNGHNSGTLFEGNVVNNFHLDAYHGSGSHQTFYRNWIYQGLYIKRFMYYMVAAGNVFGWDGTYTDSSSYGLPNIGNSSFFGNANHFTGDPHADWLLTGVLTTRTSNTSGVVTITGGDLAHDGGMVPSFLWNGTTNARRQMTLDSLVGQVMTVSGGSGDNLPAQGTTFSTVWLFAAGYQEFDDGVSYTMTRAKNYSGLSSGTGTIIDNTSDTLPNSLAYAAQPSWWTDGGFSGAWPPVNPAGPSFSVSIIPAGYRFTNIPPPTPPDPAPPAPPRARIKQDSKRGILMGR